MQMKRNLLLLIVPIVMLMIAGCGSDEPCSVQSEEFLFELGRIGSNRLDSSWSLVIDEYDEIDSLKEQIAELKKLRAPKCAKDVKTTLLTYYEKEIIRLKALLSDGEVSAIHYRAENASSEALTLYLESKFRVGNDAND